MCIRDRLKRYPHQLSGGMRQRVMIAMALANEPDLLIADEPTTALDGTGQAQILDLLKQLQRDRGMAVLFITHDLGVVANVADEVVVMYHGKLMESGTVEDIFHRPEHPYLKSLLSAGPRFNMEPGERLVPLRLGRDLLLLAGRHLLDLVHLSARSVSATETNSDSTFFEPLTDHHLHRRYLIPCRPS